MPEYSFGIYPIRIRIGEQEHKDFYISERYFDREALAAVLSATKREVAQGGTENVHERAKEILKRKGLHHALTHTIDDLTDSEAKGVTHKGSHILVL